MDYRLQDLLEVRVLQEMLDRLHDAIPLNYGIVDCDGQKIAGTPYTDLCAKFHRARPDTLEMCKSSTLRFYQHFTGSMENVVLACPHGLVDSAAPIIVNGEHVATLMVGQMFTEPPDEAYFVEQAKRCGYDVEEYLSAVRRVPVLSREELARNLAMFRVFTGMLGEMGAKRLCELEARDALEKANESLRQASNYNRSMIEASADAIAVVGPDGVVTDVNGAAERLTGKTREELIGAPVGTNIVDPALARAALVKAFKDGRLHDLELDLKHKNGHATPVLLNLTSFGNRQGRHKGLLLTARDLTQRKRYEERIGRAEQYRLLADNSTDVIMRMTPDGRCNYISPACRKVLGYDPDELLGQDLTALFHPDDAPNYLAARTTIHPDGQHLFVFQARYRTKDSGYIWTEASGQVFFDGAGHPREVQVSLRDISDRKRAEAELEAEKEYAEELIDTANAIVLVLDAHGRILEFNRAAEELTGWTKQELLGKDWFATLVPRERYPQTWALFRDISGNSFPKSHENPILTKSGEERHIAWHNSALRSTRGEAAMVCFGMDVTERRRMEDELRAYKERLGMVLKNLDAVVFQQDRNGVFTLVEGRGLQKLGVRQQDLLGKTGFDVHGKDVPVLNAERLAFAGRRATAEFRVDNTFFEQILTPYIGADGSQDGVIGLAVDITDRKLAEHRLREEKERLKVTLQSIGDGVIATDGMGRVVLMNGVAEQLTGWKASKAIGRNFTDVFDISNERTGERCENPVDRVLATGKIVGLDNHTALRALDGTARAISHSAAPILDEAKRILGVILVFRDVTEDKKKEDEIAYLSYHDKLTGLYNRTFLEEESRRLDTARQLPISVIMGDVNGLKLTNDVFGHAEGDGLLVRIAEILRECCRNEDIVARVGGDEFCILLPKTDYAAASDICRRIYARCERTEGSPAMGGTKLSISLGAGTKTGAAEPLTSVMKTAEDAMYRRKLLESRSQHSFLISSIRTTLFEKSYETEQHAQRLITFSKAIAQALGLPDDQLNDVELFALLHDIGKIAIDDHILTKPGRLAEGEWEEMRRHPEIGFRIAQSSPDLAHIAEYILCHHERWDGAGYPQGLKGTAIPLLARIMLVVDAFDAMTQDRVYRKAMTTEEACAELLLNAGTQFDPNIVWVFMDLLERGEGIA